MRYEFGGLIFGGAYFRNFTVFTIKCFLEFVLLNAIRYNYYNCINKHFCSFTVLFQPLLTTLWRSFLEQMPAWMNLKEEPRR